MLFWIDDILTIHGALFINCPVIEEISKKDNDENRIANKIENWRHFSI